MRGHGPRTASRWGGLVATAMVVVGCTLPSVDDGGATEGEGWSLAADLDAAPAQPPEQLRIAPSEARLAEVWDDWGLPDVPPAIDFDTSWAAVVTGLAA